MIGRLWRWLVSTGFRLLYNELAWTYDAVSWLVSRGEWRKWQMSALPFVDGACVLEIAHGPGHMLLALAKSGRNVTGLDTSRQMGRIAARRLRHAGEPVALVRGVAQSLPFQDHAFDTVYCSFPTSFIADRRTLEAVHRVLRANGRLVIVPEGHLTGNSIVDRFI
ncbi:MAG TPA: class I SAM-dependent methyltransferase, partial [Candidatus Binatia bacterium]|nr:class I SAM-dependent methyltransferase [Candidatus Binatia bacterium]